MSEKLSDVFNKLRISNNWSDAMEGLIVEIDARFAALKQGKTLESRSVMVPVEYHLDGAGNAMESVTSRPVKDEGDGWKRWGCYCTGRDVWYWDGKKMIKMDMTFLDFGDQFMFYDPSHPEPPQKPEGGE